MVIFINGAFGIGKTTVSRLLATELAPSALFDPEPFGVALLRLSALSRRRVDDFQELATWRAVSARAIRLAHRFRRTVIVPMAFSNLAYLDGFRSYLRRCGVPTQHFCLTAPHPIVLERLAAREKHGPTRWQLRRSAECCDAHRAPEFAEHIPTAGRSAIEIANQIATRVRARP